MKSNNMHINSILNSWNGPLGADPVAVLLPHFTNTLHQFITKLQLNPRSLLLLLLSAIHVLPRGWPQDVNLLYQLIHCHYKGKLLLPPPHPHVPVMVHLCDWSFSATALVSALPDIAFILLSTKKKVSSWHFRNITLSCLPPPQLLLSPQSKYASHSPRRAQ